MPETEKHQAVPSPTDPPKSCTKCNGRGWVDNRCLTESDAHKCTHCDGRGVDFSNKQCYACKGTGLLEPRQSDKQPCGLCKGAGVYPVPPSMTKFEFAFKTKRCKKC